MICSLKLFENVWNILKVDFSAEFLSLLQHIHQTANQVMTSWSLQAQRSFTTNTNCVSRFVRFVLSVLIYLLYIYIYNMFIVYTVCYVFTNDNNLITVIYCSIFLFRFSILLCPSHSVSISMHQARIRITCFVNLTNRSSHDRLLSRSQVELFASGSKF